MNGDKFDQLYNALKADGAVSGTREDFNNFVYAKGAQGYQNRKKLYDALHADGAVSSKSYEEFAQKLGLHATTPAAKPKSTSNAAPKKPANSVPNKPRTVGQMAQQVASQYKKGSNPFENWELLNKKDSQMTPLERSKASTMRSNMQRAQNQANQQAQKQKNANPITRSRVNTKNPLAAVSPKPYSDTSLDMDETTQRLSTPEAQKARAIQQHKDDTMALANNDVNSNNNVMSAIDATVSPSMQEADELAWSQYQEQLRAAGGDAYLRDKAWKDLQDNRYKNRQEILSRNLSLKLQDIYQDKNLQRQVVQNADKMNMSIEEYVDKYVTPQMMQRAQNVLGVKNIEEIMPKNAVEYVVRNISNSILGTLSAGQDKSKDSIIREQQAMAIADGLEEMPEVKGYKGKETYRSGVGARFISTAANMAMDSPFLGMTGGAANLSVDLGKQILTTGLAKVGLVKAGAKLTAQQLGFKVANMTMAQKISSGLLEGTAKGALNLGGYSAITSALGQASTGDDTSLGALAQSGFEGFKHGATTGAMFGASGAVMAPWIQKFGINGTETTRGQRILHGAQKVGASALGIGVEAGTMMVADNVTGDKEISVGQWLEDVVMVGAFKAGEPRNYGKIGEALYSLTHNTNNTFRFGKDSDGNWRKVDIHLTDAEKNELVNSTSGKNLMDAFVGVDKAGKTAPRDPMYKTAYTDFMRDSNVSQSTKEKVNAAMGLFNTTRKRRYRSVNDVQNKQVLEYAQDGTLLTRTSYKNADERRDILYRQKTYRDNEDLLSLVGYAKLKDRQYLDKDGNITEDARNFLMYRGYDPSKSSTDPDNAKLIADMKNEGSELYRLWAENRDMVGRFSSDDMKKAMSILAKDPMKRTAEEQESMRNLKTVLESQLFPENEAHAEQSQSQGRSIAEEEGLGSDTPNPTPVVTELRNLSDAEDALQELMDSNDDFKQNYDVLRQRGLTNPQIYDAMIQQVGLTQEELEPFARYINANARVQGMQQATQDAIEQRVDSVAGDWGFHGTMDGQQADGSQVLYVKDGNGRTLIVGTGDVSYDPTTGRPKEDVGDMLVGLDVQTREPVYVKVEDTTLDQIQNVEDFKNEERQRLQQINSAPYNQAAQEQAMKDAAKTKGSEREDGQSLIQSPEDGSAAALSALPQDPNGGKGTENNQNSQEKEVLNADSFNKNTESPERISNEKDEWGQPLVKASDGSVEFGKIDEGYGLQSAPIRLSLGENKKNPETGKDEGYGLLHIIARHGDQIRKAGYKSVQDFVEAVAKGYTEIREGVQVGTTQTYLIVKKDGHANTLYIELSRDGKYWNINSAGIFKEKYVNRKKEITPEPTVGSSTSTDTTGVNHGTTEGAAVTSGNSPVISADKDTNNSSNGNENNTSLTFEDGSPVPMVKDSKGRLTPDYGNMKPEQAADILTKQFGDSAENVVDGQIKKAEKAVKDAEKMKVDYEGEPNDILEQENLKKQTIDAANKQLEHAKAIKKAMTAKKVAETVGKEGKPIEGANQASSIVKQKFDESKKIVGRKGSITLPDGTTIRGHYYYGETSGLTPSHDSLNGFKQSEGFPVNEDGSSANSRSYKDKDSQLFTQKIGSDFGGQALKNVPIVQDGVVLSGNGTVMGKKLAERDGKDGRYYEDLEYNAEGFGFTWEQLRDAGFKGTIYFVPDEKLPLDSKTFDIFNKKETKSESNTEQAVAKSKTLSPDEVGAIVADIEGNGSLEAFFNNSKAINDLVKTLVDKGIIGQNEVAGLMEGEQLNAQGKEFVKNLLLGANFTADTIRMMGADGAVKTKVINGIRAIMENSKLGDYSLRGEIDSAIQLLYEARVNKMSVDDLLRSSDFVNGNARDRYTQISQALAQALEGKANVFRELMSEYNDVAKNYNTGEGTLSFVEEFDKDSLIKEFLKTSESIKQNNIKLYGEEGRITEQKAGDVPTGNEERPEEAGGRTGEEKPTESQQRVNNKEEKSEPITITTEHGGEKTFSSEQVDLAKKIISENPEKPITHLQRQMKIGYEAATALAKELGWQEKPTFMPKEQNPTNPIEKAAEDYKKEHPLTEEEVSNTTVFDDLPEDQKQYCIDAALDYLRGEDTSAISEAYYRNIYEKRGKNVPQTEKKDTTSEKKHTTSEKKHTTNTTDPMEALKKAAEEYDNEKKQTSVKPQPVESKKLTRKELEAERDAADNEFDAFMKELRKKRMGQANSGFIDQNLIEAAPKMFSLAAKCAYSRIKLGMYDAKEVVKDLRKRFKEAFDGFDKNDVDSFYSQIMDQKWKDGDKRMSLNDWAEYYRKLSPEHQDKLVGDSKTAEERKQKENSFINRIQTVLAFGEFKSGIVGLRKIAEGCGLEGVKDTDLQELAETAVIGLARQYASSKAMSDDVKFAKIKELYNRQPSLNQRDSDRVEKQQYSTPAPYAYLADMYVKGGGKEIKSALEPSAGNGMLTIGLPMDKVHVNDIDEARLLNLHRQGFKNITSQDGTQPFADKDVDVVVTNPPFGTATPKEYDGYKISSLEGQMAINALESMKDDGRAAIIIGGKTEYAKNGSLNPKDKAFLGYLYSHYNVEDVINVDGSLYAKQGTTYPTRIILINGRRLDENSFPPVKDKARAEAVKDYNELYKRINDDILRGAGMDSSIGNRTGEVRPESDRQVSKDSDAKGVRPDGDRGSEPEPSDVHTGISGESSERVANDELGDERRTERGAEGDIFDGTSGADSTGTEPSQSEGRAVSTYGDNRRQLSKSGGAGRNDSKSSADESANVSRGRLAVSQNKEVKRDLSSEKVTYSPKSENPFTLQSVMPADQQEAVNKNLEKLGDADQFLVDELGYNDKDDLYSHLAAEQVDSVALALHQAKQGNAFIIGDMTGIGKGRQAASLIRYARKNGQIPVYFTKTAGLLSDVYRDLVDIGSPDLRPFVFGSSKEAKITDSDGNVMFDLPKDKEVKRVLDYISKYGKLPKEYDYVLTTYSQVGNGIYEYDDNGNRKVKKSLKDKKPDSASTNGQNRRDAIERLMENGYLILDESHTAGGNSGQGNYFQHIIQKAKNVTFFSATFAKRPDNMPIYSLRTAMNQGGLKPSELIDAVKRGGATLQEIMSQTLTKCGQMIRRERDMTGVTIDWKAIEDPVVVQEQREQYDSIIGLFNDIIDFQRTYVSKYVDERNEELAAIQASMGIKKGTAALGIKNQPFASKAFNTVQQVLLSLKAKTAAERAIDYLKQGAKPVIALNNTNESQTGEIAIGEEMDAPDLGTSLRKGLEGTLRYTKKDAKNKQESGFISLEDLGEEAVSAYRNLEEKIAKTSTGLSLSPIDVIKNELQKAGYKVGELTGRSTEFVYNENGTVSKVKREDTDKKKLAREFNDGKIDALILNKSAATGISLHASSKFKDQRKRVMIVAQQQLDVNDEVQMRGRIDRTGQVSRGSYEYVVSQIPAEQRLLMMFKAKLKSLDANTTASQKSKFNEMDVADITNKYGDKVVREYATEHLDLYSKMADPFGWEKEGVDLSSVDPQKLINSKGGRGGESEPGADASKFLARMALLKVADQEKMLKEIGELYTNEINRLNEMGENDLEITELPLKAKTIGKEVWKEGSEPNGDNAFADNTYIEKVNMAILKKPMRGEEVKKAQEGLTGGRSWDEYRDEKRKAMKEYFQKKIADEKERLHGRAMKLAQKAAEKYGKEAKKNQEKNQLTDEQIEKNTQFQYDNVYNEEKKKAETVIKNIQSKYQAFDRVLDTFNTEDAFVLPSDMNNPNEMSAFGNSYGRLIDIKITDNYSPTASTVSFATLDGRRKITFPVHGLVGSGDKKTDIISTIYRLTRQADAMADKNYRVVNMSIDNWDRMISNESRKDGYIITGNLMQALIDTKAQGLGGQLVKYTTDNGEVKTGILMPDRFKPTDAATEKAISSKADDFMSGKIDDVVSSDGEVKLSSISNWRGTTIEIRVPKSKAKGGKYFLDDELRSLVDGNDFYTKGNSMVANVQLDKVRDILDRLSSLGVKVREERSEERNGTHFRTEENIKDNESSENLFVSLQAKQNNRKDYNETVNILSERVADGRADLYGVSPQPGRETQDRVSAAIEIIASDRGGVSEAVDGSTKEQRTKSIEDAVISWAEDNGKVVSEKDIAKNSFGGEMWSKGGEANVYMSKDKTKVIKFVDPYLRNNDSIQTCMENTRLFNELFPESAYKVIGVTRGEDGKFRIAMEQPFIKGKLYTEPELDEYDKASEKTKAMFESLGLYDVDGDGLRFKNDKYFVSDIHFGNVVFDADGNPHVIDADVKYYGKYRRDNIEGKPVVVDNGTHFKTEQTPSMTQNQEKVLNHIISASEKVGDKVSVVNSPEEVTNPAVKERLDNGENVTGWYDEKTGEVHLYLPNIHDRYTAEKTIWHETVGHKGMRGLFGDKFDNFLYQVWKDLDKPENARLKQLVDEERRYNPFDIYNAIEEGIARLAEDGRGERGFWNNIKNKITDLLHEVGYRIAPNTKDVKYLLWLGKNLQKNPNDPYWRMKANAVRYKLEHESTPAVVEHEGMFFGDDKVRTLDTMTKQEFRDATDGMIHFRTTPSAATALDRYEKALNAHGYMFTESYMDNMLSLKNLMQAIKPDVDKIEDINSSENPYILQNTMQGAMSNAAAKFERDVMKPLDKAMAELLDAFEGKKDEDKIRNFNLYMIMKHGLERNRVFFVRDYINDLKKDENTVQDAKMLQSDWSDFKKDLGDELRNGSIRLNEYYDKMDEWIRSNVDAEFKAGENDYSGFHGMFNVAKKDAYDDADVISRVMDSEASMESAKKGSVADFWDKVKAATQYSLDCEYKNGLVTKENHDNVSDMFDWYVPLRKFDDTTAEDVYGYVTQSGDYYKDSIGRSLMKAKGRKSLSETNILAQIGAMGNNAIYRGGNNAIKQAFARFIRNNGGGNLVTEMNVWLEKKGVGINGEALWEEALPNIPEDATADEVARIVQDFEDYMNKKKGAGNAINMSKKGTIGFKFERNTNRSQHIVDVMIAGKKHSFIINGNPRAAQALNGMLENWTGQGNKVAKWAIGFNGKITRFFAQASTSYNPEFVMRNLIKDFEFSSTNLLAKEGSRYVATFEKYYLGLNNIAGIKSFSLSDFKNGDGFGLFAKYRNGTLGNSKVEKYFKEFMENGGETGFVQMLGMKDWTKKYKDDIKKHRSHNAAVNFIKGVGETIEGLNEVAENMARFATYCASRDHGRSVVRSTYDAKEVTVNFNRKGSGSAITSFKDGELSYGKAARRNIYGFSAWWLRNTNMFFNAGIQSTNLLLKNVKNYPKSTLGVLAATPFALGALIPLVNQVLIGLLDDDEKDRKGVKNPYDELPDYVRRNNLCIYTGGGEFTTIPLAIENRAFYGLGDVFYTMMKHPEEASLGNIASQATGQIAQLVPIMDYMGTKDFGENPLEATAQAFSPSSIEPIIEWERNKDWKGQQIERRGSFYENDPAWERANSGTNGALMWLNKKANAYTNDIAKGNEEMLGNDFVDQITNPSMLQHYGGGITKGMGTFLNKSVGFVKNTAKGEKTETKDIPFVRSFFYTPSETTSMQRTKSKFYNYSDELEKAIANVKKLRSKNVDALRAVQNASDYYNFMDSKMAQQVRIMEFAQKRIKQIKKMRNKMTDTESINQADQDIGYIMQDAVEQLDKLND